MLGAKAISEGHVCEALAEGAGILFELGYHNQPLAVGATALVDAMMCKPPPGLPHVPTISEGIGTQAIGDWVNMRNSRPVTLP